MGCDTCHTTHKTGEAGKQEFDFHLTKSVPALCIDCHDVKDAALIKAHQGQPFATANCTQCHDPHQSAQPKLMQKFTHPPFAEKTCDICHAAGEGRQSCADADRCEVAVRHLPRRKGQADRQARKCRIRERPETAPIATIRTPAGSPGCPRPNAVEHLPGLPQRSSRAVRRSMYLHQPAFKQGCATCHEPHGGDNEHLLRAKDANGLCLECHGADSQPKKLEAEHVIAIFNGSVKLPEDYFAKNKVVVLPLEIWARASDRRASGLRRGRSDGHHQDAEPRSTACRATSRILRLSPTCWSRTRPTTWRFVPVATKI